MKNEQLNNAYYSNRRHSSISCHLDRSGEISFGTGSRTIGTTLFVPLMGRIRSLSGDLDLGTVRTWARNLTSDKTSATGGCQRFALV